MKRLFSRNTTLKAAAPKKKGANKPIVTTVADLESYLAEKKRPKKIYLAGDAVSLSMTSLPEGVTPQPSRTVDGNLLTKSKATLHVGIPPLMMDSINKGKAAKNTYLLVDNIIRWSLQRVRKERSFSLYCAYLKEESYLIERYRFIDRKLHSVEQRMFNGDFDFRLVIRLLEDDLIHSAYLASQDDLSAVELPEGIQLIGDKPFRQDTHRELEFGKGKSQLREYILPITVVASAIFSFYAVTAWQQNQLDNLQSNFDRTISGMEENYYSGGQEINLLERQQYFLEDKPKVHETPSDKIKQVVGVITNLRKNSENNRYKLLTLDTVQIPSATPSWDIELSLITPEKEGMSKSLQSEQLVHAIADRTGWEVITLRPPNSAEYDGIKMLVFHLAAKNGSA